MKLSNIQIAALQLMKDKPADFYQFCNIGANGSTIDSLVKNGLAEKDGSCWILTLAGYVELNSRGIEWLGGLNDTHQEPI